MLIQQITASRTRRVEQLSTAEDLGDLTPLQMIRRMKQLLGETSAAESFIFRHLFLQRLPCRVRMIFGTTPGLTVYVLASTSDRLIEVQPVTIEALGAKPV